MIVVKLTTSTSELTLTPNSSKSLNEVTSFLQFTDSSSIFKRCWYGYGSLLGIPSTVLLRFFRNSQTTYNKKIIFDDLNSATNKNLGQKSHYVDNEIIDNEINTRNCNVNFSVGGKRERRWDDVIVSSAFATSSSTIV